ncbi:MAG TPA: monovalent cation/H(+) antiporter subunit G [Mycobacteriales bacterium]|jgi:multicomponent Na+:H+ antiporter subunit G|nr:monovalent cation/H(+) antiporter subunit G [Mycobacteriales bacterium]
MRHDVGLALVAAGVLVVALACVGALLVRDRYDRLHLLSPTSSLGGPLIGVGLTVELGVGFTSIEILFIVLVLFVSGSVVSAATGRLLAQNAGDVSNEPRA